MTHKPGHERWDLDLALAAVAGGVLAAAVAAVVGLVTWIIGVVKR